MADTVKLTIAETHVLDVCYSIEVSCAELYHYFSKLHEDNPEASDLWKKTSMEEYNHAEQFRLASRLQGSGIESLKTDLYRANTILAKVKSVIQSVQTSPPPLKEALRFAIKLEQSLANYHMTSIAIFEDASLMRLFESMMKRDKEHITALEIMLETISSSAPGKNASGSISG